METISEDAGLSPTGGLSTVLLGGLTAGVLDITAASASSWLRSGRGVVTTFQSVAGGLYGAETFNGGYQTAALGLLIHFFIALSWTFVYYLLSRKLKFMTGQALLSGVIYGIFVWMFMYLIVLPLSAWRSAVSSYTFSAVLTGVLIHIFCVGLPIALVVRRFSK